MSRVIARAIVAFPWFALATAMLSAQAGPPAAQNDGAAKLPQWDVVSIRQVDPDSCSGGRGSLLEKDGLTFHCVPLMFVVEMSYQIMEPSRILGAPERLKNGGLWEIHAKVAGEDAAAFYKLSRRQRDLMVRSLLADRLHMKAHLEKREIPVYELLVAKGGPKMKKSTPEEKDKTKLASSGGGEIDAVDVTMDGLPWMLGEITGRPVLNKTGLAGEYDFILQYLHEADAAAEDSSRTSIFTALEEQLGLKLVAAKDVADVLVIDSIEQPAAN